MDDGVSLWRRLAAADLVTGDAPPVAQATLWYVRVMLGVAGWLGALFLLSFVGAALSFIVKSGGAALIVGLAACGAAAFVFRQWPRQEFASQFGLAVSFAGQALVLFGMSEVVPGTGFPFLGAVIFESALVLVLCNTIQRFVSTFAATFLLAWWLADHGVAGIAPALVSAGFVTVWLHELAWARHGAVIRPVGYGLVIAAMVLEGTLLAGSLTGGHWMPGGAEHIGAFYWAGVLLTGGLFLFTVARLLARYGLPLSDTRAQGTLGGSLVVAGALFKAPGVLTALMIVLLGFANGNRLLTGIGIAAAIAYLGSYYYLLDTTLLVKSMALVGSGIILLAARWALVRLWPVVTQEDEGNA